MAALDLATLLDLARLAALGGRPKPILASKIFIYESESLFTVNVILKFIHRLLIIFFIF